MLGNTLNCPNKPVGTAGMVTTLSRWESGGFNSRHRRVVTNEEDIIRVCGAGQDGRCGLPAEHVIAIAEISPSVMEPRRVDGGGVVFLCRLHARTIPLVWDAKPLTDEGLSDTID